MMIEKGKTIAIKLADVWPDEVALEVERVGIAFAQLNREVYLAAKRKKGQPLPEWELENPSDNLSTWISRLRGDYGDDAKLMGLIDRAQVAAAERDDIFHAIWGRHPNGKLGRWRRKANLGIEVEPIRCLLREIRDIRDSMNRHTRITDKYTLKETIIAKP